MTETEAQKRWKELAATVRVPSLLMRKRDGGTLTEAEIEAFVAGVCADVIPHEQVGAMLMAIFFQGMTNEETIALTRGLMNSGEVLEWPDRPLVVDKHSTGGVGDKISLPLAAALAACGLQVPMISGRGLGHTGGTLDKLEAIPGYLVEQSPEQMRKLLSTVGCCIVGQTATLVPGDRILYAMRDITATVESIPLITASIVSKKVAEGLNSLVLDVKVGRAAFMKTEARARELAQSMVNAGCGAGVNTVAVLTKMDNPIGRMIGNAVEVAESVYCLQGKGPADLEELVCCEGGLLLAVNGNAADAEEGAAKIRAALHDGSALAKFRDMVAAQGAGEDVAARLCENPYDVLKKSAMQTPVPASATGYVEAIDAMGLAVFALNLGAGRQTRSDQIKHEIGLELLCTVGEATTAGEPWLLVHHNEPLSKEDLAHLSAMAIISSEPVDAGSRIIDIIRPDVTAK
eukprot:m.126600 g.126600  ORF g.126600 m.126600 type:complete len:460 (+) comp9709_c1_seq1:336-1715(+)